MRCVSHGSNDGTSGAPKHFGGELAATSQSARYLDEYVPAFVDRWDELIDWDARARSEGSFFLDQLAARGVRTVLDVATGTGFHSIRMLEAGFDVVSTDGSAEMLARAVKNAELRGQTLRAAQADWRMLTRHVHGSFDAVICLGNSFTHLFGESDHRKALAEFHSLLVDGGVLILDHRNYDSIIQRGYTNKRRFYYCGEGVSIRARDVDIGVARFEYTFPDHERFYLEMFPLRKEYSLGLMRDVGFRGINTFGDFRSTYEDEEPEFFVHVAEKPLDLALAPAFG